MTRRAFFALLAAAVVGRKRGVFDAPDFEWPRELADVRTFVFHDDFFELRTEPVDVERYLEGLPTVTMELSGEWT